MTPSQEATAKMLSQACHALGNTQAVRETVQMIYRLGCIDGALDGAQKAIASMSQALEGNRAQRT